jgi:hypothetical protein
VLKYPSQQDEGPLHCQFVTISRHGFRLLFCFGPRNVFGRPSVQIKLRTGTDSQPVAISGADRHLVLQSTYLIATSVRRSSVDATCCCVSSGDRHTEGQHKMITAADAGCKSGDVARPGMPCQGSGDLLADFCSRRSAFSFVYKRLAVGTTVLRLGVFPTSFHTPSATYTPTWACWKPQ